MKKWITQTVTKVADGLEPITEKVEKLLEQILQILQAERPVEDLDWVTACSGWTATAAFAALKEVVERDVEAAKNLSGVSCEVNDLSGDRGISIGYGGISPYQQQYIYVMSGRNEVSIKGLVDGRTGETKTLMTVVPIITNNGKRLLKVGDKIMRPWQVSRTLLKDVLLPKRS